MGKLVVQEFLTMDGVMQAPGGPEEDTDGDFAFGGWTFPYMDAEGGQKIMESIQQAEGFLLGRKTYEIFAGYWPLMTDPESEDAAIAEPLNAKPKWVASRTLKEVTWNNSTLLAGDAEDAVAKLKTETEGIILVQGSGNLTQSLLAADLVDEFRLWTFPTVLGQGKRLFADGTIPHELVLATSRTTSLGVIGATYTVGGEPKVGSFAMPEGA